jgi:hypothetical protein
MIEEFSGGYYRTQMTVQPFDDGPAIEKGLYDLINRRMYSNTDAPVTMRLQMDSGLRFTPSAEGAMPTDVIGVPTDLLDKIGVHPASENINVFILKPKHAYLFHQLAVNKTSSDSINSIE